MKQTVYIALVGFCIFCICGCGIATDNVVAGTFYVDAKNPKASDGNPGTKARPWKTVVAAAKKLHPGEKLVIAPGVYYGGIQPNPGQPGKDICIEGTALGEVIITGDKALTGWKRTEKDPRVWVTDYKEKLIFERPNGTERYYVSSEPADLAVDGMVLFWRYGDGAFLPGNWNVDKAAGRIYVRLPDDGDPNTHRMTVISADYGVVPLDHTILRNLVIRRFGHGVRTRGDYVQIDNNIIEWCAYNGIKLGSRHVIVKNNTVRWNGLQGTNVSSYNKITNNRFLFTNWKLNSAGWHASGLKGCTYSLNPNGKEEYLIAGNESAYNGGLGIWLDIYAFDTVVKNNIAHDNANVGLENEICANSLWEGNVAYRNWIGFQIAESSGCTVRNNVLAGNITGLAFTFKRSRVPAEVGNPGKLEKLRKGIERSYSKAVADKWLKIFRKSYIPCTLCRNNTATENILMNNGIDFANELKVSDPEEQWMIAGNRFMNNVLINPDPRNMVKGYTSLGQYQAKTKDGLGCVALNAPSPAKMPDWAKTLYAKHADKLNSLCPYSRMKQVFDELIVRNGEWCEYVNRPAPAGLFAVANICESNYFKSKTFSDPSLKAYYIDYKGKRTLVLWRQHGQPEDFVPVLLKGVSADAVLESSCQTALPLSRANGLVSVNVGTWPLYLIGVKETITEVKPFSTKLPKKIVRGKPMNIVLENAVGTGTLQLDKYQGVKTCPSQVEVKDGKAAFRITVDSNTSSAQLRIAGTLGDLYAGEMLTVACGKPDASSLAINQPGFVPIPLTSVANCSRGGNYPVVKIGSRTLRPVPETLTVGKITFTLGHPNARSCIGFTSERNPKRPDSVTIPLDNKKYDSLAFLQFCSSAPYKDQTPILEYTLNYDDNLSESTYCVNSLHIVDWWRPLSEQRKNILRNNNTWLAWDGEVNKKHAFIYVYIWKNPKPQTPIRTLMISAADPDRKISAGVLAVCGRPTRK